MQAPPGILDSLLSAEGAVPAIGYTGLVLLYYLIVWWLVGRDPRSDHIVSEYEPPGSLSPPALRYLRRTIFDHKTLVSAVLDIAAHGCATISAEYGRFVLTSTGKDLDTLPPEEQAFAGRLLKDDFIDFSEDNGEFLRDCAAILKDSIQSHVDRRYLATNGEYVIAGIAVSALAALEVLRSSPAGTQLLRIVVVMAVAGGIALTLNALNLADDEEKKRSATFVARWPILATMLAIGSVSWISIQQASWPLIAIASMIALNLLFQWLLKAPTQAGRELMDQVDGFRDFLRTVELEKFRTLYPGRNVPETMDRFFPYAYALDLEHEWNDRFGAAVEDAIRVRPEDRQAVGFDLADGMGVIASLVLGAGVSSVFRKD